MALIQRCPLRAVLPVQLRQVEVLVLLLHGASLKWIITLS